MKKIGLLVREDVISEVNNRASDINGCFFFSFNKVNASSFNRLRNDLRSTEAKVFVAKNSSLQKAFDQLGWEDGESLSGTETAMVFSYGSDVVNVCKVLVGFSKENEFFQIGTVFQSGNIGDFFSRRAERNQLFQVRIEYRTLWFINGLPYYSLKVRVREGHSR